MPSNAPGGTGPDPDPLTGRYLPRYTSVLGAGGWLYDAASPELAFGIAGAVGLAGVGVFLAFGREFRAYS